MEVLNLFYLNLLVVGALTAGVLLIMWAYTKEWVDGVAAAGFSLIFTVQFSIYAWIIYAAVHFISKYW